MLEYRIPHNDEIFRAAKNAATENKHAQARLKECKEELEGEANERKMMREAELAVLERDLKEKRMVANVLPRCNESLTSLSGWSPRNCVSALKRGRNQSKVSVPLF